MSTVLHRLALLLPTFVCCQQLCAQVQEWVLHYNGPGNGEDVATDVAVDSQGNVCITGRSSGGGTGLDFVTAKYTREGSLEWLQRYNGPGNGDDAANAMHIDSDGNIYVTGYSEGAGTGSDYLTIKYSPTGTEVWSARYTGLATWDDEALALTLDEEGNVYVTGRSSNSGLHFDWDFATIKYDPSGVQQWVARYNGPGDDWDQADGIAVDGDGNVYVAGTHAFDVGTAYHDYATIKYNSSGVFQWVSTVDGMGHNWDAAIAVGLDDIGNAYVTGYSSGNGTVYDFITVKYNASGDQQWLRSYNTQGNPSADVPYEMIVTGEGDLYITGATSLNMGTIKYNALGDLQWSATYNNGNFDAGYDLALDLSGNVIVTGVSSTGLLESRYDYLTVLYNLAGEEQWVERFNGTANNRDEAWGVAVDAAGNIYITGSTTGTGFDATTIRYSTQTAIECAEVTDFLARCNNSGTVQARATLRNNTAHVGQIMVFMVDGEAYDAIVATNGTHSRAQVSVPGLGPGSHVVELVDPPSCFDPLEVGCQPAGVADGAAWEADELSWNVEGGTSEDRMPVGAGLHVYPNPFNPTTEIAYSLEEDGLVQMKVYDLLGREVAVLADGFERAGAHQRSFNATGMSSGVYFVRLTTSSFSSTQMILLSK